METDNVVIRLVPEKKGLILKHSEYEISTRKYKTTVVRRYNDFVTLHSLLVSRFPYRMLPRLPPKQLMLDSFLEERRRGLQRYLQIVCQHPIVSSGPMLETFLTDKSNEHIDHLRAVFSKELDEYSALSENEDLPLEDQGRLAASRENMRTMLNSVIRLKRLLEQHSQRLQNQAVDFSEMSNILKNIDASNCFQNQSFTSLQTSLNSTVTTTTKSSATLSYAITEKINLLLDILTAHSDLCDRVERGIVSDHQRALSKMLTINKQKIKGVIRGSAPEDVQALHQQEIAQNGVVGTLGRKSAFSLRCVLQETSLANKYLQILPSVLLSFSYEQQVLNSETAKAWETVMTNECNQLNQ